mgnify:CR=1 FL=1
MTDFEQRYVTARKAVIARDLARLNPMQRQGAMTTEGPLLLLAGAGSGKTTVLIQRVYNLLTYGRGSDSDEVPDWATEEDLAFLEQFPDRPDGDEVRRVHRLCAVDAPRPWEIIAITFTNKAAGELKERLAARLGPAANDVWASTFHSACVRILRRDIDRIGFEKDFTIYDTDDAKRVIKDILKEQNLDEKTFPIRSVLSAISASKDRYEGPEVFRKKAEAANDWKNTRIAKIYAAYQQKLSTANALDFDDIIYHSLTTSFTTPSRCCKRSRRCWTTTRKSSGMCWWTSIRTPTTCNIFLPACWPGDTGTSAWWVTMTSPSTVSGGPTLRIS